MTNLVNLSKKIPQTKQTLGYLPLYDLFFNEFKNKKINILEIGIDKGYSLKLWSKYFKKAKIVGIDINKIDLKYQNVELFFGDQTDINFLSKIISKYKKFDIIIDDGSHVSKHIISSFNYLFEYLSNDGIYVIEDLVTSYWPRYGGSRINLLKKNTSVNMIKSFCDSINYEDYDRPFFKKNKYDGLIKQLSFFQNIAFIKKGKSIKYHYKKKPYLKFSDYIKKKLSLFFK